MSWSQQDKRRNTQKIIRSTIERTPGHGLSPREVDRAVERGMAISDAGGPSLTFGQIRDAAVAVVKDERGR